jgi:hypothetical protein
MLGLWRILGLPTEKSAPIIILAIILFFVHASLVRKITAKQEYKSHKQNQKQIT